MHAILGHWRLLLTSLKGFFCVEHISHIINNFPQMCLMLDQFLSGHSSRSVACLVLLLTSSTSHIFLHALILMIM